MSYISLAPGLNSLIREGILVGKPTINRLGSLDPPVRSASDFSYSANNYGGPYFRLVGDAAGDF